MSKVHTVHKAQNYSGQKLTKQICYTNSKA